MLTRNRRAVTWMLGALFASSVVVEVAMLSLGWGWKAGLLLVSAAATAAVVGIAWPRLSYVEPPTPLVEIAEQLSRALYRRWKTEADITVRRGYPFELRVEWVAIDPPLPGGMPTGLKAGVADDLAESFTREPKNRVLVLGASGAGKSSLTLELAVNLLKQRKFSDPVPVLVWLASWNPKETNLRDWIASLLEADYPYLRTKVTPNGRTESAARALLVAGQILPILDGLDEISNTVRDLALKKINEAFPPGGGLVITCRMDDYAASARTGSRVAEAAAIQLRPVAPGDALAYLSREYRDTRWCQIEKTLLHEPTAPLSRVLTMPLMIMLADETYNDVSLRRGGRQSEPVPAPKDLLIFHTADDIETHLFDAYLPSLFDPYIPNIGDSEISGGRRFPN